MKPPTRVACVKVNAFQRINDCKRRVPPQKRLVADLKEGLRRRMHNISWFTPCIDFIQVLSLPHTVHQNDWNQKSMFWSFLSSSSWFPSIKSMVSYTSIRNRMVIASMIPSRVLYFLGFFCPWIVRPHSCVCKKTCRLSKKNGRRFLPMVVWSWKGRVSRCFCQVILCDPKLPKHQLNRFSFQLTPWNWTYRSPSFHQSFWGIHSEKMLEV